MKLRTIELLKSIGYKYSQSDEFLLNYCIDDSKHYILNRTNLTEVPVELEEVWINRVVAEFLEMKWATNTLDIETIDFSPIVNRIQEGDTTIDIATGKDGGITEEDRFLTLLSTLRDNKYSFARFRKIKW